MRIDCGFVQGLTCLPMEVHAPTPLSTFLLVDEGGKQAFASNRLPAETLPALEPARAVSPRRLAQLASRSRPWIGLESRTPTPRIAVESCLYGRPFELGVERAYLMRGMGAVPPQQDGWSCGVNSAARFAAMLGQAIEDYNAFHRHAPRINSPAGPIGAPPLGIQDYLREHPALQGSSISRRGSVTFAPQLEVIDKAVTLGRPVLVLMYHSQLRMHWVNIVGRTANGNYVMLNTDGYVGEIEGGIEELKHRMNCDNGWAQRCGFVERFNTVSCTEDCDVKDWPLRDFNAEYYARQYPDVKSCVDGHKIFPPYNTMKTWQWKSVRHHLLAEHFLRHGLEEGRLGHPQFFFRAYKMRYPDIPGNVRDAANHFYKHGKGEGRDASPT